MVDQPARRRGSGFSPLETVTPTTCSRSSSGTDPGSTTTRGRRPRTCSASSSASTSVSMRRRSAPEPRRRCSPITSPRLCIARFHGRNRETWYTGGPTSGDRFNYLYTPAELEEWIPAMRAASDSGRPAPRPAQQQPKQLRGGQCIRFRGLLGLGLPRPPEPVIETLRERDGRVPEWVEISSPVAPPGTMSPTNRCSGKAEAS